MIWLLDPGHGIETNGKRSPFIPPGIREYEFNRDIARRIIDWFPRQLDIQSIVNDEHSVKLRHRVNRANAIAEQEDEVFFISLHANASGRSAREWNDAHGSTVFVSENASQSSALFADILAPRIALTLKTKDRGVRRRDFYVLHKTRCPAVLIEYGFMTNEIEAAKLASDGYRELLAQATVGAMLEFEKRF